MANKKDKPAEAVGRDSLSISINGNYNAVATHGGNAKIFISQDVLNEWQDWSKEIESKIKAQKDLTGDDQKMLMMNVDQVVTEAKKGKGADPNRIERLVNTICSMAPDIFEVVIASMVSPLAGIGLVIQKVGQKAQIAKAA